MTLIELSTRVLQKLGVLASGEVADADDHSLIQTKYGSLYEQLQGLSLAAWASNEDIPEYAAEAIVQMVAAICVDEFEISDPKRSALLLEGMLHMQPPAQAEKALRKQLARAYVSSPIQSEYF